MTSVRPPAPSLSLHQRPYFETKAIRARLSAAQRAIRDGEAVILITGERGIGKTAFARRLLANLAVEGAEGKYFQARHATGEQQVLSFVAQDIERREADDIESLAEYLITRSPWLTVAIDEAHHLSPFAIQTLIELRNRVLRRGRFGLILSGESQRLESRLALPSFAAYGPGWKTAFHLPRFSAAETMEYAQQSLAAGAGTVTIGDADVRAFYRRSRGIPARINRLLDDAAVGAASLNGWSRLRAATLQAIRYWPGGLAAACLIAVGFLGYGLFSARVEPVVEPTESMPVASQPAVPPASEAVSPPITPEPDVAAEAGPSQALMPPTPDDVPASTVPTAIPAEPSAPAAVPGPAVSDAAWLMAQEPTAFTVQLINLPDEAGARAFMGARSLPGKTVVVGTTKGTGTRWLVLHGSYPSVAEARRAIAALPPELRRNQPFPRRIQSAQELLVR